MWIQLTVQVCAAPLLNEIAHPRIRERMASSYYGWYFVGSTIASWLCREYALASMLLGLTS